MSSSLSGTAPTAIFFCGLAASGKSTVARYLEVHLPGVRLSVDAEIRRLHRLGPLDEELGNLARETRERLWEEGQGALRRGEHVLFDWSLWSRRRRIEWTLRAEEEGYPHRVIYFDVPLHILRERLKVRNHEDPTWAVQIPLWELDRFSEVFEHPRSEERLNLIRVTEVESPNDVLFRVRRSLTAPVGEGPSARDPA